MAGFSHSRRLLLLAASAGIVAVAALLQLPGALRSSRPPKLLLAPMIGVVEPCIEAQAPANAAAGSLALTCAAADGSASPLIESTWQALGPTAVPSTWELGYTLPVPLLKLFRRDGAGWAIDREAVARYVRTLRDNPRPAIVYLFSTHFSTGAPIEEALQADTANLGETPRGPLATDRYYGAPIYNWSFARTDNDITRRRVEAIRAITDEVCRLAPDQRDKIRGVTLLGELHHLFPDFQAGMGFQAPYLVTDYSAASKAGFREALRARFGSIERLNEAVGGRWTRFEEVDPPDRDVRAGGERWQHIDSFAHGRLPVTGWADAGPGAKALRVHVHRNGELVGSAPVSLSRQDVLQALPELGHANPGWRVDLDFRDWPPGPHRIDVLLDDGSGTPLLLATREVRVAGAAGRDAVAPPQKTLPPTRALQAPARGFVDVPVQGTTLIHNPLAALWHAFRAQQVVDYLRFMAAPLRDTCLRDTPLYTHQIVPFTNPGWDEEKFAIQTSLQPSANWRLGVSLYGETTYGTSFFSWLKGSGHTGYGVTEFHPLKPMDAAELRRVIDAHGARGAAFVSFFLEPRWQGQLVPRQHNIFSFAPENPQFGSDALYGAVRGALGAASAPR